MEENGLHSERNVVLFSESLDNFVGGEQVFEIKRSALLFVLGVAIPLAQTVVTQLSASLGADERPLSSGLRKAAQQVRPLHEKKRDPQPGDWLTAHQESGQTFVQYARGNPNRPTRTRTTIYIQPLGSFDPAREPLIKDTAMMMTRFYGVPVKVLDPVRLNRIPDKARRVHPQWGSKQLLTTYLLYDVLLEKRPKDAVAVLGLTTSDLWPGDRWNFVFGQADLRQRVGVWSTYRNGDPAKDYATCLRRTLRTAVHETGHMLGIKHCIAYECLMNGSNSRQESDRQPMHFCPECVRKVWWACGANPIRRYKELAVFAEKKRLGKEAQFWRKSIEALD